MHQNRSLLICFHTLLIVASSILFSLSFPNPLVLYGVQGLGFLCLVPAWYALAQCDSIRLAWRYGKLFGLLSTLMAYYWLTRFGEYSFWTLGGVAFVYIVEYGLLFVLIWLIVRQRYVLYRALLLALLWTGYEYTKSMGFLGFPWTLLAQSVHEVLPLIQVARLTGTWGLSFLLAYGNAVLLEWVLYEFHTRRHCYLVNTPHTFLISKRASKLVPKRSPRLFSKLTVQSMPKLNHSLLLTHTKCLCILLACTFSYGWLLLYQSKKVVPTKKVAMLLVQQNLDSWANIPSKDSVTAIMKVTKDALQSIEAENKTKPQLIVWSETSLVVPYQIDEHPYAKNFYSSVPSDEPFTQFMAREGIPLLTGTPWIDSVQGVAYNSAVLVNSNAKVLGRYGKNQLVPFAEFIPFFNYPVFRNFIQNTLGLYGTWLPSGQFNTIDVALNVSTLANAKANKLTDNKTSTAANLQELHSQKPKNQVASSDASLDNSRNGFLDDQLEHIEYYEGNLPIGVPICFEDSFSYVTRNFKRSGAELLLNITNVSWSKTKVAQAQQFAAARFRSIETGLVLVRSTNSGITSVIDPWGRVLASIPMFEANSLQIDVPLYNHSTLYMFWGDFIGILAVLIMSVYCVVLLYWSTRRVY